ncbi:MAG: glycerol-3-phosphate dehydrogenase [Actinomycetota bacterium]
MSPVAFDRGANVERLGREEFDVLVIGGGITGAGVALDAVTRGLSVALVDKGDFASGTSSKSSKLVHGGLRYLQQKEFRLVYENLHERQRLLKNAPHLVSALPFLIPILGKNPAATAGLSKIYSGVLRLYDLTGGVRIGHRYSRLSKEEALKHLPTLKPDRLAEGFLYWDARADDARLTLTIARTAAARGAVIVNYAPVSALTRDGSRVNGAVLDDGTTIRAGLVVNATGVWADHIQRLDGSAEPVHIRPAKGVHVTVMREKVPADIAVVVNVPGDRRSIFVVPWGDHVYLGTTDTDYDGPIDNPVCTPEDVTYLLSAINAATTETLTEADVVGTWAGLRPLVADARSTRTADLSRRHTVTTSPAGVVTVTGGKLTTYRAMAEDTVNVAVKQLKKGARRTQTKRLKLVGAEGVKGTDDRLVARFGNEAAEIKALIASDVALGEALVPGLEYVKAEAVWSARHEMVHTLADVLARRTRALLLDREATLGAAESVAELVAPELGWSATETASQVQAFKEMATI